MKRRDVVGFIASIVLFLGGFGIIGSMGGSGTSQSTQLNTAATPRITPTVIPEKKVETPKPLPVCDGTTVMADCVSENITYKTYVYHPAVPEKTHTETVTTYEKKITSQCTLCVDGTYSPSCATGRGACSHHGGVAQWNAPVYTDVPVYSTKTIIDAPAQAEFYDKVAKN